ncbi:MAG: transcription elongation factor Spt5 [Candidatus Diapherotrites archaeon]|nr:transcription elongation factor Spt5 [Candidatus Diapherotrites archaeon]
MIFTVRVTAGQESLVADMLKKKLEVENPGVTAILVVPDFKGYILVEGETEESVKRAIIDVPHIKTKGLVVGEVKISELSSLLEAHPLMEAITEGAKVRIVTGTFKGEIGRVIRVNNAKEEVTIELVNAAVRVPVTIKAENIRLER